MKFYSCIVIFIWSLLPMLINAQNNITKQPILTKSIKKLIAKVEAQPYNLEAHHAFISNFKIDNPELETQYKYWIKKFPKIYTIPFAIGEAFIYQHPGNPKALPYLLLACKLKEDKAEIWYLLSKFAGFNNNVIAEQNYLKKAIHYAPDNPYYAFYYAYSYSFQKKDHTYYDSLSLEVARKFPKSEASTMSLLWLAFNSTTKDQKIAYYKMMFNRKENQLSEWYLKGIASYFDLLLDTYPEKAFELGVALILENVRNRNLWFERIKVADSFLKARKLLNEKNSQQALSLLNDIHLGSKQSGNFIDVNEALALFKAEIFDSSGRTSIAYDSLTTLYSRTPTSRLYNVLSKYACKLGIDSSTVLKNIWKIRENNSVKATDFCLKNYLSEENSALSDYLGKVILIVYWEPACFPCRAQFSHIESVIKKFDTTKVVYLALNTDSVQDSLVLPFLKTGGYSFIPLKVGPTNFKSKLIAEGILSSYLIDTKGRIIFSNFRITEENEKTLELMIQETLAVKQD